MYFGQLWKPNVNIRLMKILYCNWKPKFWSVASVCKHIHVAIKKKTFGLRFLLARKSVCWAELTYHFSLCDAGNIIMVNNDKICFGVHYLLTIEEVKVNKLKGALSGLRQFFATESPLKMMKNAFYFTSKALFVLKIFKFLS